MNHRLSVRALLAASILAATAPAAEARPDERPTPAAPPPTPRLTASYTATPLRDVLADFAARTGLRVRPLWPDDQGAVGLDPQSLVTLEFAHAAAPAALDAIARGTDQSVGQGTTWQFAEDGAIEIGPRTRLNAHPITRVYDIRDLTAPIPDFADGATLDLAAALSGAPGGSVLRDPERTGEISPRFRRDREEELVDLITRTVETDQWWGVGGASTILLFRGQLIIHAPGYIHRQVSPTSWPTLWPAPR